MAQAFIGTYSVVGVSWMFAYFRDSFITKQDIYRWAEPSDEYKDGKHAQIYLPALWPERRSFGTT